MGILKIKQPTDKPTRYYSNKQEKRVAKEFGGKQTSNSGATAFQKSDVLLEDWNIECKTKTSDSDSISIKKEWLEKIEKEGLFMGKKYSALMFNFGPSDSENHVIINEWLFKELQEYLRNKEE